MRKFFTFLIALAAVTLASVYGALPFGYGFQGGCGGYNSGCAPGPTYTGPGNVQSGAKAWFSCARGYSAASVGVNACQICDAVACTSSACNVTAAHGSRPTLAFTAPSSLPTVVFNGSSQGLASTTFITGYIQPLTVSMVADVATNPSGNENTFFTGGTFQFGYQGGPVLYAYTGNTTLSTAVTAAAYHAVQYIVDNTGGSSIYLDGTSNSGSVGNTTGVTNSYIRIGFAGSSQYLNGAIAEIGVWNVNFHTGAVDSAMNTNQHGTNGYNF
jgi:hypothetical protein